MKEVGSVGVLEIKIQMKIKRVLYFVGVILLFIISYFYFVNRTSYINSQTWRYSEGAHFGDVLYPDNAIRKKDNTNWKLILCYGETLLVKNIDTKGIGYYHKIF